MKSIKDLGPVLPKIAQQADEQIQAVLERQVGLAVFVMDRESGHTEVIFATNFANYAQLRLTLVEFIARWNPDTDELPATPIN